MGDGKYPPGYIPLTIHEISTGGRSGSRSRGGSSDPHAALDVRDDSYSSVNGNSRQKFGHNNPRRFNNNANGSSRNGGGRRSNNRRRRGGGRGGMQGGGEYENTNHESAPENDDFDDGSED
jgi:hypothetical protein